eukprot:gene27985-51422_t
MVHTLDAAADSGAAHDKARAEWRAAVSELLRAAAAGPMPVATLEEMAPARRQAELTADAVMRQSRQTEHALREKRDAEHRQQQRQVEHKPAHSRSCDGAAASPPHAARDEQHPAHNTTASGHAAGVETGAAARTQPQQSSTATEHSPVAGKVVGLQQPSD